jgi:trimeric autotransporter adhesin
MRRVFFWFAFAALGVGLGCVGDPTASLTEGIGGVVTSVNKVTLNVGDSALVVAELRSSQWTPVEEVPDVVSQTPAVATVSFVDLPPLPQRRFYVKAVGFGEGTVVASGGGQSATVTVTAVPAGVLVAAAPAELGSGATAQLAADPLDTEGNSITAPDSVFTWSSSPASVISISPTGLATAQAPGTATVTVTAPGGATGTASITVVAGVFAGTLSAASAAPGTLVTATKAAAGPDFDADSKATLAGASAWIEAFTADALVFAVPATGATTAATLTLSDMGANQLAQNTSFTPTSALDVWSPGNITNDCSDPTSAPSYNTEKSANGWLYFSHNGTTQGGTGCYNGGSGYDHFFTYTTGAAPETVEIRTEWKVAGDMDLYVCNATLTSCPITGFSGATNAEVIAAASLAASTTYYIVYSPYAAGAGSNSVRLRIQ